MNGMLTKIILGVLIGFSTLTRAQNDPITVDVELSRSRVYVGDDLTYQVIIRGSANPPTPVVDFPSSVQAVFHGRSSQSFTSVRIINGRNQTVSDRRYSYQYTITTIEAGTIEIPPPVIEIDGQQYTGRAATVVSVFPVESDVDNIEMTIEQSEIYLNQTIVVEGAWWIGAQTSDFSFSSTSIPESFEVRGLAPQASSPRQVGFEIGGEKVVGALVDDRHKGRDMKKLVFRFNITPTQTGTFTLGPLRAVFTRQPGLGGNYRSYAQSPPIEVTVKAVPTENQPAGYSGAIGSFRLGAYASNTNVNVGDPIELTLRITGREPMVGISNAPNLSDIPGFADQFKISSDGWRESLPRQGGQRVYQTTIRALNARVNQIPAIEMPSFNPTTGSYRINQSSPIDITVHPVEEITLSDAVITGGSNQPPSKPSVERRELTPAHPGLWAHGTVETMLDKPGFSLRTARKPIWIAAAASGPTIFAFSLLFVLARGAGDRRAKVLRVAYRQGRALDRKGHHAQAMRLYIAAALGINEDAVVADDAARLAINEDDIQAVEARLVESEWDEFAGTPPSKSRVSTTRPTLLKDVYQQTKHAQGNHL